MKEKESNVSCPLHEQVNSKKKPSKKYKRISRTIGRRQRRKRSKCNNYYKRMKQLRYRKRTEANDNELCSAVTVIDLTDMDWAPGLNFSNPASDVSEWHKHEQVAHWKSRAISLEYENRMLHQHLRNMYAQQIQTYVDYNKTQESPEEFSREEPKSEPELTDSDLKLFQSGIDLRLPPKEPVGRRRKEEMKILYGTNAPKIMGMETALQLNYERYLDKIKPEYWPHLPFKL